MLVLPDTVIFTMSPVPILPDVFFLPEAFVMLIVPFVHPRVDRKEETVVDGATPLIVSSEMM